MRRAPRVGNAQTEKALQDILDRLLKMEERVKASVGQPRQAEGAPGSVRAVKESDGTTSLQIRTEEGWSTISSINFQQKE